VIRRFAIAMALLAGVAGTWASSASAEVPHFNHVFIIVLENEDAADTFGDKTEIPYLAKTMTSEGALVKNYYATGHLSLDNYISMVSGQAPNPYTQADCPFYINVLPGTAVADGQTFGVGCVYPTGVQTIANQLEGNGYTWKGYMQDMANSAPSQPATCRHPTNGTADGTQMAKANDQYAARHNPFVYFHSIIDFPTCQANDVDLRELAPDLRSADTTPNYAFITPDLCNDGHDEPCVNGDPGGMKQASGFLKDVVPQIAASPAYQDRGLIIVTFDEAEGGESPTDDGSACCGEQSGPNTPSPGALTGGPGGGRIGAVMVSNCIQPGTVSTEPYNHYSLLRSVEDNFGLPHLGYAGAAGLQSFGKDVLNMPSCPKFATACKLRKHKKHKKRHKRTAEISKHKKHKKHKKQCKKKKKKRGKKKRSAV
jgi:phosphatidylinositol-3-phosphatase